MNILINPSEMADRLIAQCHVKSPSSYWTYFGMWCREYPNMPEIYIQAIASEIMQKAQSTLD